MIIKMTNFEEPYSTLPWEKYGQSNPFKACGSTEGCRGASGWHETCTKIANIVEKFWKLFLFLQWRYFCDKLLK